jgi:hypothetical protein
VGINRNIWINVKAFKLICSQGLAFMNRARACFPTSPLNSDPPQPGLKRGENLLKVPCDIKGEASSDFPLPQQTRIFERFYRVDETRARSTGGTGLGLSIVKTLVEGMGGTVSVRSQLGEGSTFTVTLPNAESK